MKGFYKLSELDAQQARRLAERALALRAGAPARRFPQLALGLLFMSPSLRTQASMQRAAAKMALQLIQLQSGGNGVWNLELRDGAVMDGTTVEHVREAAAVLGRFVDMLAIRAFAGGQSLEEDWADPVLRAFQQFAGVPIVNLESAQWHPCQALADWSTLDLFRVPRRAKFVLTWAWHPKPLPQAVPNSTLTMAAQRGMDVVVLRPDGYDLRPEVLAEARALAAASGGTVTVTSNRKEALEGASVVYAKSWGSLVHYGDAAAESAFRSGLRDWCVSNAWFSGAAPDAKFMHCLPVRRNVVVRDEVLDGPRSIVIDQAENRLHAQTALLEELAASVESARRGSAPEAVHTASL